MEKSLVNRIYKNFLGFIKKIQTNNENKEINQVSYFKHILEDLENDDEGYSQAEEATTLFDEALRLARQRANYSFNLKNIEDKLKDVKSFSKLTDEEVDKLKNLLDSFLSLKNERNSLMYQLTSFDKGLEHFADLKNDAKKYLPEILEAEKNQRLVRYDIGQLGGEKESLEDEAEMLKLAIRFLNKFNMIMVVVFVFAVVYVGYVFIMGNSEIFVPTSILVLLAIVLIALIKMFKRRSIVELKVNVKRRNRVISLLNKKNVVYVHYTNYLKFAYNKYKVNSAKSLEMNVEDYQNYKFTAGRVDSIRRIMYETESAIENFLKEKNIVTSRVFVEDFAQSVKVESKMEYYKTLETDKAEIEAILEELDKKQKEVMGVIENLIETDTTKDKLVSIMMHYYQNEIYNLFDTIDNEENN